MAVDIKLGDKEKKLLGAVVAMFLFALVLPQFVGEYTLRYRSEQGGFRDQFQGSIATVQQDLDSIEDRKEILRRYITRYQSLVERRVLSLPDAVDLVKHMKDIATERKQSATKFDFGDNVVLAPAGAAYTKDSTVGVNVYPLNVAMGMLHDMDIFMFMESLNERVSSVSFPVQCSLVLEQTEFQVANRENMQGSCRINWYAVSDPERNLASLEAGGEAESAQS
ncbi:MAG: hypothetical protein ACR2QC_06190 [Gammaproteobacteria bacterium]